MMPGCRCSAFAMDALIKLLAPRCVASLWNHCGVASMGFKFACGPGGHSGVEEHDAGTLPPLRVISHAIGGIGHHQDGRVFAEQPCYIGRVRGVAARHRLL